MPAETLWRFDLTWKQVGPATDEAHARALYEQMRAAIHLGPGDPYVCGRLMRWQANQWGVVEEFFSERGKPPAPDHHSHKHDDKPDGCRAGLAPESTKDPQ